MKMDQFKTMKCRVIKILLTQKIQSGICYSSCSQARVMLWPDNICWCEEQGIKVRCKKLLRNTDQEIFMVNS